MSMDTDTCETCGNLLDDGECHNSYCGTDWYARRNELEPGMIFMTDCGNIVRLDRGVPGDGTRWYVDDWDGGWFGYDSTIEPGDLTGEPLDAANYPAKGA